MRKSEGTCKTVWSESEDLKYNKFQRTSPKAVKIQVSSNSGCSAISFLPPLKAKS